MNGKLSSPFCMIALMSCSQPPVKERGPSSGEAGRSDILDMVENHLAVLYRLINLVTWLLRCPVR